LYGKTPSGGEVGDEKLEHREGGKKPGGRARETGKWLDTIRWGVEGWGGVLNLTIMEGERGEKKKNLMTEWGTTKSAGHMEPHGKTLPPFNVTPKGAKSPCDQGGIKRTQIRKSNPT